jgi:hypothetical protein
MNSRTDGVRRWIGELRNGGLGYLAVDSEPGQEMVHKAGIVSLPLILGHEDEIGQGEEWSNEQARLRDRMQLNDVSDFDE